MRLYPSAQTWMDRNNSALRAAERAFPSVDLLGCGLRRGIVKRCHSDLRHAHANRRSSERGSVGPRPPLGIRCCCRCFPTHLLTTTFARWRGTTRTHPPVDEHACSGTTEETDRIQCRQQSGTEQKGIRESRCRLITRVQSSSHRFHHRQDAADAAVCTLYMSANRLKEVTSALGRRERSRL